MQIPPELYLLVSQRETEKICCVGFWLRWPFKFKTEEATARYSDHDWYSCVLFVNVLLHSCRDPESKVEVLLSHPVDHRGVSVLGASLRVQCLREKQNKQTIKCFALGCQIKVHITKWLNSPICLNNVIYLWEGGILINHPESPRK